MKIFLVLVVFVSLIFAKPKTYENYSVIGLKISPEKFALIEKLYPSIDVWSQAGDEYEIMVNQRTLSDLKRIYDVDVLVENVQTLIDQQFTKSPKWNGAGTKNEFFNTFHPYEDFLAYIDDLIAQYPTLLTKYSIGQSIQSRDLVVVKLTTGGVKTSAYIESTIHAREWLAPTTSLWGLTSLLEGYAQGDPRITRLVTGIEWHYLLFLNPDGYVYTWTTDRLWRKNRRQNVGSSFYGVDLNRNWGPNNTWCTSGSSTSPSSDTYCGTSAFSEPETFYSSQAMSALSDTIGGAIAYHTYGPLLLRPFQYSYNAPPEPYNREVTNLGAAMETAINSVYNYGYESIQGSDLYPHSGGTIDWSYFTFNIPAFTIELRGVYFVVPDTDIILAGEENFQGLLVFGEYLLSKQ